MPGLEDTLVTAVIIVVCFHILTRAGKYHWALIVGPIPESHASRGSRFHAKKKKKASRLWQSTHTPARLGI